MCTVEYGPVLCIDGPNKGRIGYCDDIDIECEFCTSQCCFHECDTENDCSECPVEKIGDCQEFAIVYWGDILCCTTYEYIPIEFCTSEISMIALINRIQELNQVTMCMKESAKKARLLQELNYITTLMYEKHIETRFSNKEGLKLFISYSSKDKDIANCIFADLVEAGHDPWIDEWNIRAGQPIPEEIQKALDHSDYILVLLSPNSSNSEWVRNEWQTMYWQEMSEAKIKVIPILIDDCAIPPFLRIKKYVDMREDYVTGLRELIRALNQ